MVMDIYINPKVYILVKGEKDIDNKIEYIKKIDSDNKLYNTILKEQIFINDNYTNIIKKTEMERSLFLKHIFSQDKILAKRKDDVNRNYKCN